MGIDGTIDLSREHRATVLALLEEHLSGTTVWAHGSRVTWNARETSDLDLVVFATPEQTDQVGSLREALEESNLPFRVDLLVWDDLPTEFRERIDAEHVALPVGGALIESDVKVLETVYGIFPIDFSEEPLSALCESDSGIQTGPFGSQLHQRDYVPTGTPIITVEHLNDNRISHGDLPRVSDVDVRRLSRYTLRKGDIVFSRVGSVDRRALVREAEVGWLFSGRCLRVRPNPSKLDSSFLSYFFGLPAFRTYIRSVAVGATMPSLNTQLLRDVTVPCPPHKEQRAIGQILGTLDDRIELNRRMSETLEAMARALFKSWFVDFDPVRAKMEGRDPGLPSEIADLFPDRLVDSELGEIPEGWAVGRLADIVEINPARLLRRGETAPYLDMANMPTTGHVPRHVRMRPAGSGARFINGDTLVARITPCLENGKTAYVDCLQDGETGWGSTEFIVLHSQSPVPEEFAYCLARSHEFREHAIMSMTGTSGRQRVPPAALAHFTLPLATSNVLAAFGTSVKNLFAQSASLEQSRHGLIALRDALLPKLISGEVRLPAALVDRYGGTGSPVPA